MTSNSLPEAAVFIAASVDGYIAREDGSVDWLPEPVEGEDYGYGAFAATIDALVFGRKSFEKVLSFGVWPYAGKRVVVLSSGAPEVPEDLQDKVEVLALEPEALLRYLGEQGVQRVYVDGGQTIQRFLRAGLIQEMILTRIPVLLGAGIPLFGALPEDVTLEHIKTTAFPDGLVQSRYRIAEVVSG